MDKLLKLLAVEPGDAFVLYGLAQEYGNRGEHAAAVSYYDRCLAADGTYLYAYYHKAYALNQLGKSAEARATTEAGIAAARAAEDAKALSELQGLLAII